MFTSHRLYTMYRRMLNLENLKARREENMLSTIKTSLNKLSRVGLFLTMYGIPLRMFYTKLYIHIYICIYSYIQIMWLIRRPLPELERARLHPQSTNTFQSCKLQSAITAIPCNPPSCKLQSTYTAKCTLPYCIISKGQDFRATGPTEAHRAAQDG